MSTTGRLGPLGDLPPCPRFNIQDLESVMKTWAWFEQSNVPQRLELNPKRLGGETLTVNGTVYNTRNIRHQTLKTLRQCHASDDVIPTPTNPMEIDQLRRVLHIVATILRDDHTTKRKDLIPVDLEFPSPGSVAGGGAASSLTPISQTQSQLANQAAPCAAAVPPPNARACQAPSAAAAPPLNAGSSWKVYVIAALGAVFASLAGVWFAKSKKAQE